MKEKSIIFAIASGVSFLVVVHLLSIFLFMDISLSPLIRNLGHFSPIIGAALAAYLASTRKLFSGMLVAVIGIPISLLFIEIYKLFDFQVDLIGDFTDTLIIYSAYYLIGGTIGALVGVYILSKIGTRENK